MTNTENVCQMLVFVGVGVAVVFSGDCSNKGAVAATWTSFEFMVILGSTGISFELIVVPGSIDDDENDGAFGKCSRW